MRYSGAGHDIPGTWSAIGALIRVRGARRLRDARRVRDARRRRPAARRRGRSIRERVSAAMMSYRGEFAHSGDPGTGRRRELPAWRPWAESRRNLIFDNDGIHSERGLIHGPALLEALWADPHLSPEQKCAIFLDDTMFPAYPLEDLAAHRCRY